MKKSLPYLICAAIGGAVAVLIMFACYKIHAAPPVGGNAREICGILSNSFLVPGVVLAGLGLISFASNDGAFDMLAFAAIRFFDLFKKGVNGRYKNFYEYREAKKDGGKRTSFMLTVGAVFTAVSVIFLICYYNV